MTVPPSPLTLPRRPTIVRCFWHGSPLGPYQLVGLQSFVDQGHRVELYTYDFSGVEVPDWIERKDAQEIWPADHVLRYQKDIGRGSFALHSNLFRYALLFKLGGWWIDLDVVLLRPELPQEEVFFSMESFDPPRATFSVLKFPKGHPSMKEALEKSAKRRWVRRRFTEKRGPTSLPRWWRNTTSPNSASRWN